ncbi:MAG: ketoacyl-ACP synthase III [Treponema sp.]|jgi:3-oxoacyl-[acyl-carrier-protein] synthase-3|nr:ketoacyl-ACP synthase III [Treponema sp.]
MAIEITGTGRAIPFRRIGNDELAEKIDTSDEWIRSHTGIGARHIADENTACSDLALEAAKNALAMAAGFQWPAGFSGFDTFGDPAAGLSEGDRADRDKAAAEYAGTIDLILLGTATADYCGCPPTACIVQDKLGAGQAAAMDISACCTGFIYGLETAAGLLNISGERKRALVIGSEVLSRLIDWDDRSTAVLFGDGAGAAVLEKTSGASAGQDRRGLLRSILGADGSGRESLIFRRGGSRNPFKAGEVVDKPIRLEMNGQEVYYFAVKAVTMTIEKLLKQEGVTIDEVSRIVPHQANARIVQAAGKRLRIPMEKFFLNIEEYANTSAASIPIALDELNRKGELKKGNLIMTIGFGGGLTYGGNLIVW